MKEINGLTGSDDFMGIQRFSHLRHFKSTNYVELCPPCIGHDIFEGVCVKIFYFSIKYFISKKFFNFGQFLHNISSFEFIGKDKSYFPKVNFENPTSIRFTMNEAYTFLGFTNFISKVCLKKMKY